MNHEPDAIDWADPAAGAAALCAFERLADTWHLTLNEKLTLLGVNRATWYQWQQGRAVTLVDVLSSPFRPFGSPSVSRREREI